MKFSKKTEYSGSMKGKPWRYIGLSFLLPFFILLLGIIALHIVPFGEKHSLAITDAQNYLNGLMSFSRMIRGEGNYLYSLQNGLGGNQWSGLAWGGLAPASLLALFAKLETIPSWFTWICLTNLSLCGLTMYILLAGVWGHKFSHLIFSTAYAMIGFSVVNCYQTGFFHGMQLLPLMVLGLVWLFRGRSPLLYILSLGICSFLNFYFAFHLCVATLVIFLAHLYVHHDELAGQRGRPTLRWLFSSLIAGFLGAPMWLPALKAYSGGGRLDHSGISDFQF